MLCVQYIIALNLRVILFLLLFLMFTAVVQADDKPKRTPTAYGLLYNEWEADRDALENDSTPNNIEELKKRKLALRKTYTHKFLELAKKHTTDDLWLGCFIWVSVHGEPGPDLDAMMDLLHRYGNKVDNRFQLQMLMSELTKVKSDRLNPALSEIIKNNISDQVRGAALYALAARTKKLAEHTGSLDGCKQAETLLLQVIDNYPDIATYRGKTGENAKKLLKGIRGPVAIGKLAPELIGKDIDGASFKLSDERGKVIVLSFSGHWCAPCRAMHPIEKELLKKYPRENFNLIEINSDEQKNLKKVAEKTKNDGLTWKLIVDGSNGPISEAWNVTSWPTFYILDQKHQIRHRGVGNLGQDLTAWVDKLIDEPRE
ncbi:Thiol-disulfide oxidoreductase ResA [Gimesia aquarii]|uniref:Thiol-disulfide oxidoreductase ResA n=1 Tax=Gimesia aquarii TaxID=2527964 RepID=A0A517WN93_9PLAN|nr:Thiol-disulfide oxidoreductase ResA [Gimesia aquarii]